MYQAFGNPKQNSLRKWEGKGCGCLKSQLAGHTHRDTASDLPLPSPLLLLPGCFSHVWLCATPCTAAHQALLSMGILQARILEWVAMSSSRGSFQPRDRTQVSHIAGRFFTSWATPIKLIFHLIYFLHPTLVFLSLSKKSIKHFTSRYLCLENIESLIHFLLLHWNY